MKILEMLVTPCAISDPPLRSAFGLHAPYALRTIIELITDDGLVGLSETHGGVAVLRDLELARPLVIGMNPAALTRLEMDLNYPQAGNNRLKVAGSGPIEYLGEAKLTSPTLTFGAIEVACLDLLGQFAGLPLCDLLGGRFRDTVPFSAYLFYKYAGLGGADGLAGPGQSKPPDYRNDFLARQALQAEEMVRQAQEMCERHGFQSLKLKGGVLPPAEEVRTIFALREAFGPHTPLRIDPNGYWSVETAIKYGRQLENTLEYYEDPVSGKANMSTVAKNVPMPLATNMCCISFGELPETIQAESVQIILSDHHIWGGLLNSVKLAKICQTWKLGLSMHSNTHLGISLLAMTHLAAAIPNLTYACDTHYPWQVEEVIAGGKLQFEGGSLKVPDLPGLGAKLDQAALAHLHENYLRCGITQRNDRVEMAKIEPGWQPHLW
jgi:glucarate dehydratase